MAIRTILNIRRLNAQSWLRDKFVPKRAHISGHNAAYSPETEVIPVINFNGKFLKTEIRSVCESEGLIHPTIHLFLFDDNGRLLVQKRGAGKVGSGGKLAQSVEGHISLVAESYNPKDIVLQRSLFKMTYELLGVDLCDQRLIKTFPYQSMDRNNREMVFFYESRYCGKVQPNYTGIRWAAFFKMEDIRDRSIQAPGLFSRSFLMDLNLYWTEKSHERSAVRYTSSGL